MCVHFPPLPDLRGFLCFLPGHEGTLDCRYQLVQNEDWHADFSFFAEFCNQGSLLLIRLKETIDTRIKDTDCVGAFICNSAVLWIQPSKRFRF